MTWRALTYAFLSLSLHVLSGPQSHCCPYWSFNILTWRLSAPPLVLSTVTGSQVENGFCSMCLALTALSPSASVVQAAWAACLDFKEKSRFSRPQEMGTLTLLRTIIGISIISHRCWFAWNECGLQIFSIRWFETTIHARRGWGRASGNMKFFLSWPTAKAESRLKTEKHCMLVLKFSCSLSLSRHYNSSVTVSFQMKRQWWGMPGVV